MYLYRPCSYSYSGIKPFYYKSLKTAVLYRHILLKVGTGRYRRSHKYHDKNVDKVWVSDNGYMVTVSTGSKFVKIWKVGDA